MISKILFSLINAGLFIIVVSVFISTTQSAWLDGNFSPVLGSFLLTLLFLTNIISNWKSLGIIISCIQALACLLIIPITIISVSILVPIYRVLITEISKEIPNFTLDEESMASTLALLEIVPNIVAGLMLILVANIIYQAYRFRKTKS